MSITETSKDVLNEALCGARRIFGYSTTLDAVTDCQALCGMLW